jgi:hypothetical protein
MAVEYFILISVHLRQKETFMRVLTICLFCLMLALGQASAEEKKQAELTTDIQKLSYALGLDLGSYFKTLGEDLDLEVLQQGLLDS